MKKILLGMLMIAVVGVIALGTTGFAYAQTTAPQANDPIYGYGSGMMFGRGNRGNAGSSNGFGTQDGILHDAMMTVYSEELGIPVDELETRLADGETLVQIALDKGLAIDEITALMTEARSQAIAQAVADGTLTQEQADWMSQHMGGRAFGGRMTGARGFGAGQFATPDCPHYPAQ